MYATDLPAARWIKSSHSANNGACVEVAFLPADARWIKSSHSTNNGACVEIALDRDRVAARDSKNPYGPVLTFERSAFRALVESSHARVS